MKLIELLLKAEFNKMKLMTGAFSRLNPSASMWFHIGANMHKRKSVYQTMTTAALGLRNPTVLTFISLQHLVKQTLLSV